MNNKKHISEAFNDILENLVDGEKYKLLPPKGPSNEHYSSIDDKALDSLDQDIWGQDEEESFDIDENNKSTKVVELPNIKRVFTPEASQLDNTNIIGIYGDNKRILTTSFHLILTRTSIVNFRYTSGYEKPYFYNKERESTSLLVLDSNIFDNKYRVHTYNKLIDRPEDPLLDHLVQNSENKPFRFRYDYERSKKAPNSQSLGLAVKFQHTQELSCIDEIDFKHKGITVCLKNGPIFSNSTKLIDIRNGLKKLFSWRNKNRFYIGVSSKVSESRVLIKTLLEYPHLIQEYFPNQNITEGIIRSFGSDALLLKKILLPGTRTPLIEYIEKTREGALDTETLKGLKPLTCYYQKRSKPFGFVRLEIPRFMWEDNKEQAELAISIAIWQYELDGALPLVLRAASEQCSLSHDKMVVEHQMKAAFEKKNLELVEFINLT